MCCNCYHRRGRSKPAFNCEHKDRPHYSRGLCQHCYVQNYHEVGQSNNKQSRRVKSKEDGDEEDEGEAFEEQMFQVTKRPRLEKDEGDNADEDDKETLLD